MSKPSGGLLVYSPLYRTFSYGPDHPLRPVDLEDLLSGVEVLGDAADREPQRVERLLRDFCTITADPSKARICG